MKITKSFILLDFYFPQQLERSLRENLQWRLGLVWLWCQKWCSTAVGLTTVLYTAMAVQNMVLYRYAPYHKKAILTKSWLETVQLQPICASRVPAGGWQILLDPSLRFNTYLIFNNYLVIKFLSG